MNDSNRPVDMLFHLRFGRATLVCALCLRRILRHTLRLTPRQLAAKFTVANFIVLLVAFLSGFSGKVAANGVAVGNFPQLILLCKYADEVAEPHDSAFVQELFGDGYGGVNHFWKLASYGKSSIDNSTVLGWYTLPWPRNTYFNTFAGGPNVNRLVDDCTSAADSDVDFSAYDGVNVLTNGAWSEGLGGIGGQLFLDLDGKSEFSYTAIGYPDWLNQALLVHELGHGFGLLHSNNSDEDDDPYDNPWTVMSDVYRHAVRHPEFGLLAKHFNTYELETLGWLEEDEVLGIDLDSLSAGNSQVVTLTALGATEHDASSYRLLKLLRAGSGEDFYFTLEARQQTGGYEAALPGTGVIIHEVDLRTRRSAWVVDEAASPSDRANTAGVIWEPGEIYRGDGFAVEILSRDGAEFSVEITATNGRVDGNSVPFFQSVATEQNAATGRLFQLYLHASDTDGFVPHLDSVDLPAGSQLIDNENGVWIFEWTPRAQQIGPHRVNFVARDALDDSLTASLTVNINVTTPAALELESSIPSVTTAPGRPEPVVGNVPWVTLLCKFADEPLEPATAAFVQDMFGDGLGQINHWWKHASYQRSNINGSLVLGWYTLPSPRSAYIRGDSSEEDVDDERLTRECMHAADEDVDFSRFYGVNTFFNSGFNSFSVGYGKPRFVVLDDAGVMATTAISNPAWTRQTSVIHEMTLGVGLPRANNSDRDDTSFDNPWTNTSDGQGYAVEDLRYDLLAKHLSAFEKYSLGWFSSSEIIELRSDVTLPGGLYVRLTPLSVDTLRGSSKRAVILHDRRFDRNVLYAIEARDNSGKGHYDDALPGTAVIVHQIDMQRDEPAWSLYDTSDGTSPGTYASTENDMWKVGETIRLAGASIDISGRTRDGFNLYIETGLEDSETNTSAGLGLVSGQTVDHRVAAVPGSRPVNGWLPWATLLCSFPDGERPRPEPQFVEQMFGAESGQLGDYWRLVSNDDVSIAGSEVFGWYDLRGSRADYVSEQEISRTLLEECIALADADVDFSEFYGINLFFDGKFNQRASGFAGRRFIQADSAGLKPYTAIGHPSWQWQAAVAHEMARGMGLSLTDNADEDDNLFDNPWTLMSDSRAYAVIDPLFNFRAKLLNAHDLEWLGWLRRGNVIELDRAVLNNDVSIQIQLDNLASHDAENPVLLKIPAVDAGDPDYYIEARDRSGPYDGALPFSGVLIHEVRYSPSRTVRLFHDSTNGLASDYAESKNDVWTPGESTELSGVELEILDKTATGYRLIVSSQSNLEKFPLQAAISSNQQSTEDEPSQTSGSGDPEQPFIASDPIEDTEAADVSDRSPAESSTGSVPTDSTGGGGSSGWVLLIALLSGLRSKRRRGAPAPAVV